MYLHVRKTCAAVNQSREYATNSHYITKIFVAKRMISSFAYREQISCIRILTKLFISLHIYKIFLWNKNDIIDSFSCIAYKHHALASLNIKMTRTSWKNYHKHKWWRNNWNIDFNKIILYMFIGQLSIVESQSK